MQVLSVSLYFGIVITVIIYCIIEQCQKFILTLTVITVLILKKVHVHRMLPLFSLYFLFSYMQFNISTQ